MQCLHTKKRYYGENCLSLRSFRGSIKRKLSRWHTVWPVRASSTISIVIINDSLPEDLTSKKRYAEAGRVLLDYAQDDREAVITLVQGNQFSEARRVVS